MGHSRRADAVIFGFDFQISAAIVLFLENIKDVQKLRLESDCEDIELELEDGKYILAQAKAVEKASIDFRNVRANMKKAMLSLSEGAQKVDAKELIMITNSPDPFHDDASKSVFYGRAYRKYDTLPDSAKRLVDDYLLNIPNPLNTDCLTIQVIPFETDDENERYKVILEVINGFLGDMKLASLGIGRQLMDIWKSIIIANGGKEDASIKLSKKDIIWPILVKVTDSNIYDDELMEQFDVSVYEEVINRYADTIEDHCERCDFFIKVLSDYSSYKSKEKSKKKTNDFIKEHWEDFSDEFSLEGLEPEIQEAITKIVMYQIIRRKFAIDNIKKETNL